MNKKERFALAVSATLEIFIAKEKLTREQADRITANIDKPEYMKPFLDLLGISYEDLKGRQYDGNTNNDK